MEHVDDGGDDLDELFEREFQRLVRALAVCLHHLADLPVADVAALLDVSGLAPEVDVSAARGSFCAVRARRRRNGRIVWVGATTCVLGLAVFGGVTLADGDGDTLIGDPAGQTVSTTSDAPTTTATSIPEPAVDADSQIAPCGSGGRSDAFVEALEGLVLRESAFRRLYAGADPCGLRECRFSACVRTARSGPSTGRNERRRLRSNCRSTSRSPMS